MYDISYMWNLKRNELTKQKETHRLRERHYGCLGKDGEGTVKEFGINKYTLLYLKWIINKDTL